jgi:hypothetical protein
MNLLFFPRTFTKLQGRQAGALALLPSQQPPNPFLDIDDDDDDAHKHLELPDTSWPTKVQPDRSSAQGMISQITDSLFRGETETILSPSIAEFASGNFNKEPSARAVRIEKKNAHAPENQSSLPSVRVPGNVCRIQQINSLLRTSGRTSI